ncbi:hypothetical protein ACP4OV_012416 [Aristida adscensionis]
MDPSKRSFTNLLNQAPPIQPYENSTQNSPPQQFPINFLQSQFPQAFAPQFLQNFNPFGPPGNTQPYGHSSPIIRGAHHQGNWAQPPAASFQGIQHGMSIGAAGNTSSHESESSSRCPAKQQEKQHVTIEESSDSSEDGGRRAPRINWSEEENIQLLSAWLHNSVDSVSGNDNKSEYY